MILPNVVTLKKKKDPFPFVFFYFHQTNIFSSKDSKVALRVILASCNYTYVSSSSHCIEIKALLKLKMSLIKK